MYDLENDALCSSGIIPHAASAWRDTKPRCFFSHSCTATTPHKHTLQQMGLLVTKAFGLHNRNIARKMGTEHRDSIDTTLVNDIGVVPESEFLESPFNLPIKEG